MKIRKKVLIKGHLKGHVFPSSCLFIRVNSPLRNPTAPYSFSAKYRPGDVILYSDKFGRLTKNKYSGSIENLQVILYCNSGGVGREREREREREAGRQAGRQTDWRRTRQRDWWSLPAWDQKGTMIFICLSACASWAKVLFACSAHWLHWFESQSFKSQLNWPHKSNMSRC